MATNTYVALATHTLSSAVTSYTFTSIPQTYTDLVIISSNLTCTGAYTLTAQLNGDTGSNYSWTVMAGNGSTSTSLRAANDTRGLCFGAYINGMSSTVPSVAVSTILNYSNTTTYKTSLSRLSTASLEVDASSSLWRSTAAVTSIKLMSSNPLGNLKIGTTFTIYGIKAQVTPGTAKATGGTITYDQSGNVIHTFTSSGTFTPSEALSCDYLVVAGGGGTANNFSYYSGGGGAGGLRSSVSSTGGGGSLESKLQFELSTAYTVTVGAGGAFGNSANGTSGGDSSISGTGITTVTSIGGGFSSYYSGGNPDNGGAGGSGGGAGSTNGPPYSAAGGAGTSGQGYAGGAAYGSDASASGGGGGAGGVGGNGTVTTSGNGGAGVSNSISGTTTTYACGGAGVKGYYATNNGTQASGWSRAANLGIGASAIGGTVDTDSNGGSGIVIIRYSGL